MRRHLEVGSAAPAYKPRPAQPRLTAPYEDCLRARVMAWPDLSGKRLLRCQIDAFAAMDGAPSELLHDRMKTAVIGENANGVVQYNASLVALLNPYGAVPRACKPYRAKTTTSTPSST